MLSACHRPHKKPLLQTLQGPIGSPLCRRSWPASRQPSRRAKRASEPVPQKRTPRSDTLIIPWRFSCHEKTHVVPTRTTSKARRLPCPTRLVGPKPRGSWTFRSSPWPTGSRLPMRVGRYALQSAELESELSRLRAENARLRMEREILKKATAFFAKESK